MSDRAIPPPGGGGATGKANGEDDVVVFRSSPAMALLNIPERRRPVAASASASEPAAPTPTASPWRWPVALMFSAVIVAAGLVAYKRMNPPQPAMVPPVGVGEQAVTPLAATEEEQMADAGPALALAPAGDAAPGAASDEASGQAPSGDEVSEEQGAKASGAARDRSRKAAARRARRRTDQASTEAGGKPGAAESADKPPAPAAGTAKAVAKAPRQGRGGSALDELINDAIGGEPAPAAKAKPTAAPAQDLPEQLTMNQIRQAMNKIKAQVQGCYDQFQVEGMAQIGFKIMSDGSAKEPTIKGKFRGTDTGACVVKAVNSARFPKFSGKPMTINSYPFLLQ